MRSLPFCLLLAFLSAVPCACNRSDKGAAVEGSADDQGAAVKDDVDFLEPVLIPGGVADDTGKVGYLANPKGGIDAVDLESGKLLWHSAVASFPLLVYKDRLLAQDTHNADPIRIVALDVADKGKRVLASDPIQLAPTPKEQKAIEAKGPRTPGPEPAPERKATTFCRGRVQQGQLHLIWRSQFWRFTARIDLATGKVTQLGRTSVVERHPSTEAYTEIAKIAADPKAFGVPQKLPELAKLEDPQPRALFNVRGSMDFRTRWVAGDVLAVLLDRAEFERSSALLVLWDVKTGKNLHSSVVLRNGTYKGARDNDGVVYPAFHGRYVVHTYTASGFPDGQPSRPVKVYSLETRKWSPTIRLSSETGNVTPAGPRLFFTSKGMLKAVDLALDRNGAAPPEPSDAKDRILWERPVLLPTNGLPSWEERREP
jgi:hypothetical protein